MYTNQALGCEQRAFCKLPHLSLDHCSGLPLLSLLLQSPSNLGCLPAAARAILPNHKSDHMTPHAPASSPSHQKQERSQTSGLSRQCSLQGWGLGENCPLQSHLISLTLHLRCVLPSLFLLLKTLPFLSSFSLLKPQLLPPYEMLSQNAPFSSRYDPTSMVLFIYIWLLLDPKSKQGLLVPSRCSVKLMNKTNVIRAW